MVDPRFDLQWKTVAGAIKPLGGSDHRSKIAVFFITRFMDLSGLVVGRERSELD